MIRTANPALNPDIFRLRSGASSTGLMTLQGTVNKTMVLLLLVISSAAFTWINFMHQNMGLVAGLGIIGAIVGLGVGIATALKQEWAPVTAPIYAAAQGLFLGGLSAGIETQYPGIVMQAVGMTFGTLFCLLGAYKSGLIKATENFKLGIVAATGGIMVVYLVAMVLGFFGIPFLQGSGLISIGFSLFVVTIAALNLVLDFDFIEQGAQSGAPKHMEWYGAFGLMVTLIWLYVEILRLLAKLRERD